MEQDDRSSTDIKVHTPVDFDIKKDMDSLA